MEQQKRLAIWPGTSISLHSNEYMQQKELSDGHKGNNGDDEDTNRPKGMGDFDFRVMFMCICDVFEVG